MNNASPVKVLVVDDERWVRDALSDVLKEVGFEPTGAANGAEALSALSKEDLPVALVDINMPGMSGVELLKCLARKHPRTAVIMISGATELDLAISTLKLGAFDYVTKPFSIAAVVSAIERALAKRKRIIDTETYKRNLELAVRKRTVQLQRALAKLEATYDATIRALGGALELRDYGTEDHSLRAAHYSLTLAGACGETDPQLLTDLRWGAYLHDIGKIGIPDSILLKPGPLDDSERAQMQRHPELGHRILSGVPFLRGVAELVLSHHEWYNGAGYPRCLSGEYIPFSARIFTVADTVDAMTVDRPYRRACSLATVAKELRTMSGVQFDPRVVEAFFSVPGAAWGRASA